MKLIKGFVEFFPYRKTTVQEVASLGEISTYSLTFSRYIAHHYSDQYPNINLITTMVADDGVESELDEPFRSLLFEIFDWVYTKSSAGELTADPNQFRDYLLDEFDYVSNVELGQMQFNEQGMYAPEFVRFDVNEHASVTQDHIVQFWFSDESFRFQYNEYEIEIVPYIENVDDFIDTPASVQAKLDDVSMSGFQDRIQAAKGYYPPTSTRVETFNWVYPPDETVDEIPVSWAVLIWGVAGDNVDAINYHLQEQILERSSHPRGTWESYFPGLFKEIEFTIIPFWDKYSILNQQVENSLYSPIIKHKDVLPIAKKTITRYPEAQIENESEVSSFSYKNVSFIVTPAPDNWDPIKRFSVAFSDYLILPTTSTEYSRMSEDTRAWLDYVILALQTAEQMSEFSAIPVGITRLFRIDSDNDEVMYATFTFNQTQYHVLSKESYLNIINKLNN